MILKWCWMLFFLLDVTRAVVPCFCNDSSPPESLYECWQQKELGKCDADWMKGYCECTCGKCDDLQFDECVCSDTPPPDSPITCYQQSILGKCEEEWMQGSCGCSCGKCGEIDINSFITDCNCGDIPPPESSLDCWVQAQIGKCEEHWMTGFCQCSCGTCDMEEQIVFSNKTLAELPYYSPPAVLLPVPAPIPTQHVISPSAKKAVSFTIIHFNDMHARVEPAQSNWWPCNDAIDANGECYGGVARMRTVIEDSKRNGKPVLVLDAGDDWVGTEWNYYFHSNRAVGHFLNDLYIDALTLGNHEFDHGPDALADYVEQVNFPVLSCNMEANGHDRLGNIVKKYVVKQIDGVNVGILGVTTEYTNYAKAAHPEPVYFTDHTTAVRECTQQLKSLGVDIIIGLTHLGYGADKWLATQIPDLDIIIGGHSHSFLYTDKDNIPELNQNTGLKDTPEGTYPTWIDSEVQPGHRVAVLQAGWATRYIGKVEVEFNAEGKLVSMYGAPILLGGSESRSIIQKDQKTNKEVTQWKYWEM